MCNTQTKEALVNIGTESTLKSSENFWVASPVRLHILQRNYRRPAIRGTTHLPRKTLIMYQDTESHLRRITHEAVSAIRGQDIIFVRG
jgi:hypothetical protein